jgi:hypothetical protein
MFTDQGMCYTTTKNDQEAGPSGRYDFVRTTSPLLKLKYYNRLLAGSAADWPNHRADFRDFLRKNHAKERDSVAADYIAVLRGGLASNLARS